MSLHHLAQHLATKGRGEDSVLIHMTPKEVAGLQHLARASGGSLTINPHTGLPEAGFLSAILPMIAGAAATVLTGGAAAPVMSALAGAGAGAVTKGATSGDWSAGSLLGGALSGFGGAGVGSALGTAGGAVPGVAGAAPTAELAASTVPGMTAADLGLDTIAQQSAAAGLGGAGAAGAGAAGAGAVLPATTVGVGANPAATIPQSFSAMGQGIKNVAGGNAAGFETFAGNVGKYPAIAGAMGTMMNMQPEASAYAPPDKGPTTYKRTHYRPGEVNTTDPDKPYFVGQGFDPYETYTMAQGGAVPGYAAGGAPASTSRTGPLSDYIAGLNKKLTSPISWAQQRQGAPAAGATQGPNVPPTGVGTSGGIQALYNQYMNGTLSPGMMNWISGMRGGNTGTGTGTTTPSAPATTPAYTAPATTPAYTAPATTPAYTAPSYAPIYTPPAYVAPPADVTPAIDQFALAGDTLGPFVDSVPATAPPATDTASAPATTYPELQDFAAFNPSIYNNPAPTPAPTYEPPAAINQPGFIPFNFPSASDYLAAIPAPPTPEGYTPPAMDSLPPADTSAPSAPAFDYSSFVPTYVPPAYEPPPAPAYEPPAPPVFDMASYLAAYAPQTPAYEPPAPPPTPAYEPPATTYPELQDFAAFNPPAYTAPAYEPPAPAAVDTSAMYVPPTVDTSTVATAPAVEASPVYEPPVYTPPVVEPAPAYTAPYMPPVFDMASLFSPPAYTPPAAVPTSSMVDMSSTYSAPAATPAVDTTPAPSFTDLQDMSVLSTPYYSAPAPTPIPSYTASYTAPYIPPAPAPAPISTYTPPVSAPVSTYTAPAPTPAPSIPSYTSAYMPSYTSAYIPSYTAPYTPPAPVYTPPPPVSVAPTTTTSPTTAKALGGKKALYASGGGIGSLAIPSLGGYSDGGRLLRGPGDGVSDDIPAGIYRNDGSRQEARLADGEFVIDAQTVSKLGNGSTEAGAKKLYAMMDRIHAIRTRPGKDLHADRYLPA